MSLFDDMHAQRDAHVSPCMLELLVKLEAEIRKICDELVPGWTLENVGERVVLNRPANSNIETLYVDGEPILRIYPVVHEVERTPHHSFVMTYTQRIERLSRRPAAGFTTLQ